MYGWFRLVVFVKLTGIAFGEIPAYAGMTTEKRTGMTINQKRLSVCAGMTNEKRTTNRNRTTNGKRKTIVNYQLFIVNYFAPDTP
jgi:hypothetical protein